MVVFAKRSRPRTLSNFGGNTVESDPGSESEEYESDSSNLSWDSDEYPYSIGDAHPTNKVVAVDDAAMSKIPAQSTIGCNGYSSDGITRRFVILESVVIPVIPGRNPSVLVGSGERSSNLLCYSFPESPTVRMPGRLAT